MNKKFNWMSNLIKQMINLKIIRISSRRVDPVCSWINKYKIILTNRVIWLKATT